MTVKIREPECVLLKRRGAEHIRQLIEGKSVQEQLEFWRHRTDAMQERQKEAQLKKKK
uniref:hypothetical protein n=1 Tax=Candidatus Electrothrix sp. TaxID=2170559 RepID=UPI004056AD6B